MKVVSYIDNMIGIIKDNNLQKYLFIQFNILNLIHASL